MGIIAQPFNFNGGRGIVHINENDAKFTHKGEPIFMCFHRYCGPMFTDKDDECIYPDDSPEWKPVWDQWEGWWDAKGKFIYEK